MFDHAGYPWLGGSHATMQAIEIRALGNPRKAVPGSLPGEVLRQRHPEFPYI
ncbi:hypothetical protein OG874_42665 [Nocardia sp. NBC_00565]|uniref:hypothetical protein n=1 Tax=Nocardia sp. NBC_00565 TaxID=2975993 RepID=UPI002E804273|nr:hypothetical protein [Nocardia sp. NBC_00565]WUC03292.1 hypothetical protein OG874_42665 [Nocardia sp. NBC_00565]